MIRIQVIQSREADLRKARTQAVSHASTLPMHHKESGNCPRRMGQGLRVSPCRSTSFSLSRRSWIPTIRRRVIPSSSAYHSERSLIKRTSREEYLFEERSFYSGNHLSSRGKSLRTFSTKDVLRLCHFVSLPSKGLHDVDNLKNRTFYQTSSFLLVLSTENI